MRDIIGRTSARTAKRHAVAVAIMCVMGATQVLAEIAGPVDIDIDAQPLRQALDEISETYDLPVIAAGEVLRGKRAPAISGRMTSEEAVARLLEGTGLAARRSSGGAILISAVASPAPPSDASDEAPERAEPRVEAALLEELIVTGEKRERSLQDTQSSVVLFTETALNETFTPDLDQLLLRTPNVNPAFGNSGFAIRGIAQNGPTAGLNIPTSNMTLTVTVDDVPLTTSGQTLAGPMGIWDLERVEIFRGPQSSIQGRNALAGAMFLVSKTPTYEWSGAAQIVGGEFGTRQWSVAGGGPLVDGKLAFRASFDRQQQDGFIDNLTNGNDAVDGYDRRLGRLKLLAEPTEDLRIVLTGILADTEEAARAFFALDEYDAGNGRVTFFDQDPEAEDESILSSLRAEWSPSDRWTYTSITTYTDQDRARSIDGDGTPEPSPPFTQADDVETLTQELRAIWNPAESLQVLFGAFYADIDAATEAVIDFPSELFIGVPGATVSLVSTVREETENVAVFAEVEWRPADRWTLVGGLRYDDERVDSLTVLGFTVEPPIVELPPPTQEPTRSSYDAFLPKLRATYEWTESFSTSLTYQRGYRSGGADFALLTMAANLEFDAEFTNNYELALRSVWLDGRLTVNANLFYTDWTDQQVSAPLLEVFPELADSVPPGIDPNTLSATVNAGESEVTGAEFEFSYVPADAWNLFLGAGYQSTEFEDFPFPDPVDGDNNLAGNEFRFAPELSYTAGIAYGRATGLHANANLSYSDGQFSDNVNDPRNLSDSYAVVNVRAGYRWDRFSASVFANNLLDEDYLVTRNVSGNQGIGGTERLIGVQVRADF